MSQGINSILVQQDFNAFDTNFTFPKDNAHITTLFIGNNPDNLKPKQKEIYASHKAAVKVPIKI